VNAAGLPFCTCTPDYHGKTCFEKFEGFDSDCRYHQCGLGASCLLNPNSLVWRCDCPKYWGGAFCDVPLLCPGYCAHGECIQGGITMSSLTCMCFSGYYGTQCEIPVAGLVSDCRHPAQACMNGGTCQHIAVSDTWACFCTHDWTGVHCQVPLACQANPCVHGVCHANPTQPSQYQCSCYGDFTGTNCDASISTSTWDGLLINNDCRGVSHACLNGGVCSLGSNGMYSCTCPTAYIGLSCEIFPPCDPNPCQNGGDCYANPSDSSSYLCICETGFLGTQCTEPFSTTIVACENHGCLNGGRCLNNGVCLCTDMWRGQKCEVHVACVANPCGIDGVCSWVQGTGVVCNCIGGFYGDRCEHQLSLASDTVDCRAIGCENGGVCGLVSGKLYQCRCEGTGYFGDKCQNLLACDPNPCGTGSCIDLQNGVSYSCVCPGNMYGDHCEISLDTTLNDILGTLQVLITANVHIDHNSTGITNNVDSLQAKWHIVQAKLNTLNIGVITSLQKEMDKISVSAHSADATLNSFYKDYARKTDSAMLEDLLQQIITSSGETTLFSLSLALISLLHCLLHN